MTVGALLDAGASADALFAALASLNTGARFRLEKTLRRGIAASKFHVDVPSEPGKHRHLPHILKLIEAGEFPARAKANARAVFETLGRAEASVHGVPIEKVHFHEVGAVDSICDIVGACVALDLLGVEQVYCSPMNVGSGTVNTEHGVLPVPAPATAALLAGKPIYARGPELELTTPTGAALAATLSVRFGAIPPLKIEAIGYGAGDKDFPQHANVLRVLIGDLTSAPEATEVTVIEANIDDSNPQVLGHALELLMDAGALDASLSPLQMKKNRPGSLLRVIARPADAEALTQLIFRETSTLGLRTYSASRRVLERVMETVQTPYGPVRMKVAGEKAAPEFEDCRRISREQGIPLQTVMLAANLAYRTEKK